MEAKSKRGGARPGAGRKSDCVRSVTINVRLTDIAARKLAAVSASTGKSRQTLINKWAESMQLN